MRESSQHNSLCVWLGRLPALLLIVVASIQIALAQSSDLLAWKGGGFGMFAYLDGIGFREIRVFGEGGIPIEIGAEFYAYERRCKIHPSNGCLADLARAMKSAGRAPRVVEVWRTEFHGDPLQPRRVRIAELDSRAGPGT
jgi:hypothetical protein